MPATEFDIVFSRLKEILQKYSGLFTVKPDTNTKYGLYAKVGPATLKAWGGKMKKPAMPFAWVEIEKTYVSYHLMGIYMNPKLQGEISKKLKTRTQGKTCFNFKKVDETIFEQLDQLTARSIDGFKKMGFIIE
ncbi:MAG TPA: hypothetical protein VET23_07465 [Chitinophagaceae bacterium]|nr:hypothetical protein [Chitinophagaceae bacterium]